MRQNGNFAKCCHELCPHPEGPPQVGVSKDAPRASCPTHLFICDGPALEGLSRAGSQDQNIRLSFTSSQRPPLTCCTWVMVLARWSVLENLVGGELKMSRNFSPDSSASIIFWPVRSLPALLA